MDTARQIGPVEPQGSWLSRCFSPSQSWDYPRHRHQTEPDHQFVLVTGATRGIGAETARALLARGHTVVTHYRDDIGRAELDRLSSEATREPGKHSHYPPIISTNVDLTDASLSRDGNSKLVEFAEWVRIRVPKLDGIVLNAGESLLQERSWLSRHIRANHWIASNEVMLELFVDLLHDFDTPGHLQGRVVFVSSSLADTSVQGLEQYGRVKRHGEKMLGRFFSGGPPFFDHSIKDILAFAVRPGSVDTRLHRDDCLNSGSEAVRERTIGLIQNGQLRLSKPIGELVAQMALSGCSYDGTSGNFSVPIERLATVTIGESDYRLFGGIDRKTA